MPQFPVSPQQWNKEFSSGRWNYLDTTPTERARSAVIGMYCQYFFPHGKILDVGCGLGTTVDFLNPIQKKKYLGLDISAAAIKQARKKKARFEKIDFLNFQTKNKFDIIIFNEVLYYLDESAALNLAKKLLTKNGKIIVSLYRMKNKHYDKKIWRVTEKLFQTIEAVEISGTVKNQQAIWKIEVLKK